MNDESKNREFPGILKRFLASEGTRAALVAFLFTRVLIMSLFLFTGHTKVVPDPYNSGTFNAQLNVARIPISRNLRTLAEVADANWYIGIARFGYEQRAYENSTFHNWAFFPLYPMALRTTALLTRELTITGILLSHFFFFLALLVLYKTAVAFGLDNAAASRTLFYISICPASYFFSLPLPESLFLLTTTSSFYFAKTEHWWLAGLCGALATATRFSGLLIGPALLILYWQTYRSFWPLRKEILSLALIPLGLVAYMFYLRSITGNAFAFRGALAAWGRQATFFLTPLIEYFKNPFEVLAPWNFNFLNSWAAVITLVCGIVLLRRKEWALASYTLVSVFVALSTGLLQSQARYALVVFPTFMVLAGWGKNVTFDTVVRTVSLVLLTLMSVLFASHFSAALS
jgi:hypothetical protein